MRITVFGTGYVGLVQGSVLAEVGHDVLCVDVDAAKVEGLKAGRIPIYEPGLEEMVQAEPRRGAAPVHHRRRRGGARTAASSSSPWARPPTRTARPTSSYVLAVAATIAGHMTEPKVVVTKSTVPVGTADKVRAKHGARCWRRARLGPRLRRGLEPGVPQGGRRGRRLHAPRPHRHRHLRPRVRGAAARGLRPVQPQPRQDHRHGRALGRAHQVRGQRHAGDQDQLHERDGRTSPSGSGPTSRWSARASAPTSASAITSSIPAPATAGRASPRT